MSGITPELVFNVGPDAWEAFRATYCSLGPCHARVDRWRYDLKWNVPEEVVGNFLAEERRKAGFS